MYSGEVASGLADIHQQNIVHRDIKLENIFVTQDNHLKIGLTSEGATYTEVTFFLFCGILGSFLSGDLGLAKQTESSVQSLDSRVGTWSESFTLSFSSARVMRTLFLFFSFFLC
jgi:serine/threonine protein kinase